MENRLSPAQRQTVARQDAPFLAMGLVAGNSHSFEAHLRQAARLFADRQTSASPSGRLVRHITDLFERSVPESARARLACRNGCAFCCHQPVRVSAAEAFFLAGQVRERPDTAAHVHETALALAGRDPEAPRAAWKAAWPRCPLLDQGDGCSVHAARALSCHGQVSLDVEDCKISFAAGGAWSVREPAFYDDLRNSWRLILQAALRLNGLSDAHYELNAALDLVLHTENAEKRWLGGENIFAGLKPLAPNKPEIEQILALIAARIGPTL